MSNINYWEKLTFSKPRLSWKENLKKYISSNFLFKKIEVLRIWRNVLALKKKRYKVYLEKCLFWHYCLLLSFVYNQMSSSNIVYSCHPMRDSRMPNAFWKRFMGIHMKFLFHIEGKSSSGHKLSLEMQRASENSIISC